MPSEDIRRAEQVVNTGDWGIAGDVDEDQVWGHVISRRCTVRQAADGRWDTDDERVSLAEIIAQT